MAKILGVPLTTYANWEQGRSFPSVDRLPRIAAFFDVTVDYLMGANRDTVNRRIVEQLAALSPEQRQAVELVLSSMNSSKKSTKKNSTI
jgi:transcriptional regulator with XRE-family HTH domain